MFFGKIFEYNNVHLINMFERYSNFFKNSAIYFVYWFQFKFRESKFLFNFLSLYFIFFDSNLNMIWTFNLKKFKILKKISKQTYREIFISDALLTDGADCSLTALFVCTSCVQLHCCWNKNDCRRHFQFLCLFSIVRYCFYKVHDN